MDDHFMEDEQVFSSAGVAQNIISNETKGLRRHLGLGESPGMPPSTHPPARVPLFSIERAPSSPNGAKCKLLSCSDKIEPGQYRVALNPGMSGPGWVQQSKQNSDFYHVACFEKIADMSQPDFFHRIEPVTRATFHHRNLKANNVFDGDYLCDGGAERLVLEWKVQRVNWIDKRYGIAQESMDPAFDNLLRRAGSSTFTNESLKDISRQEEFLLLQTLAPFESDGPGDTQEWNLFDSYLNANDENLYERHDLSNMLQRWQHDVKLATHADNTLTDRKRQAKAQLGEKAIRAIKRLSAVPMPDAQSVFPGRSI